MSTPNHEYYFQVGRNMKSGRNNPGILVVDNVRTFNCNWANKEKTVFHYICKERMTVGVKCRAKAVVILCPTEDGHSKPVLSTVDVDHQCQMNLPKAMAKEMIHQMKEMVRKDPQLPVSEAINKVRLEFARKYEPDDDTFDFVLAELGPNKPLARQLLRVREEVIGKMPLNRDEFQPNNFLVRLFGEKDDIEVMDSNDLEPGWENKLKTSNIDSRYRWENYTAEVIDHESHLHDENENQDATNESFDENTDDFEGFVRAKRVLAYSSPNLLKLFSKNLKSSVDGTFKSACTYYKQNFIWMLKVNGYWVPVVHGWLPDKSLTSYKVTISDSLKKLSIIVP